MTISHTRPESMPGTPHSARKHAGNPALGAKACRKPRTRAECMTISHTRPESGPTSCTRGECMPEVPHSPRVHGRLSHSGRVLSGGAAVGPKAGCKHALGPNACRNPHTRAECAREPHTRAECGPPAPSPPPRPPLSHVTPAPAPHAPRSPAAPHARKRAAPRGAERPWWLAMHMYPRDNRGLGSPRPRAASPPYASAGTRGAPWSCARSPRESCRP